MNEDATPYAGFVTRTVAIAIDSVALTVGFAIVSGVVGLILSLFTEVKANDPLAILSAAGVWTVVVAGYFTLFWSTLGATPGMRLMRLAVLEEDALQPPGFVRCLIRFGGLVLSAIPLCAGFFWILVDDRRRGWQDILARTIVVYAPEPLHPA
jgi:uncharacterized RDD family membrane protein YckC